MRFKKVISLLISVCIVVSSFAGLDLIANALTITYDTQGGSTINQTTATTTKMTGFTVKWKYGEMSINTGFNAQYSYGYVKYQFAGNYTHPDDGAVIMTCWQVVEVNGKNNYVDYLYTLGDREIVDNALYLGVNKKCTQSITEKSTRSSGGSGVSSYIITYEVVGIEDIKTVSYITVTNEIPTKDGMDFAGWKDANGNSFQPGQVITDKSVKLYAQWKPHEHVYTGYNVQKTCTDKGYILHKCACGDSFKDNFVEPGHSWDTSTITQMPYGSREGTRVYTCIDCGYQKSVKINAVDMCLETQYGPDPVRQSFNLFMPSHAQGDCALILFIHGGAWMSGSKDSLKQDDYDECVKYGIAKASLNYRYISPTTDCDDLMDDIDSALAKIKEIGKSRGINFTKVILSGVSAGSHLALLYAYSRADTAPIKPAGVFDCCGPSDLNNSDYKLSNLGASNIEMFFSYLLGKSFSYGNAAASYDDLARISAINYVNSSTVPTIICHGLRDVTVPYSDSAKLDKKLTQYGVKHEFITLPNSDHTLENDSKLKDYFYYMCDIYVGELLLDDVPDSKHYYQSTVTAPTCTEQGYTTYVCSGCGDRYVGDYVKPSGHTPGEWQIVTPATYSSTGLKNQICSVCKQVIDTQTIEKLTVPQISVKENSDIVIDEEDGLLSNIPQGTTNLSEYLNIEGCCLEYERTASGFGTGTVVKLVANGAVYKSYTIVILGDATGDGYVDAFDVSSANEYINNFEEPESTAFMKALDIYNDGFLDATDLAFLISISNYEV